MARSPQIPSYRRHSSSQARVTLNGKENLLGLYGSASSKEAYRRLIKAVTKGKKEKPPGIVITEGLDNGGHTTRIRIAPRSRGEWPTVGSASGREPARLRVGPRHKPGRTNQRGSGASARATVTTPKHHPP